MKTVYKYPTGIVQMPKGAIIRKARMQNGEFFVWAEVMLQNGDVPVTPSLQRIGLKNEQQC